MHHLFKTLKFLFECKKTQINEEIKMLMINFRYFFYLKYVLTFDPVKMITLYLNALALEVKISNSNNM